MTDLNDWIDNMDGLDVDDLLKIKKIIDSTLENKKKAILVDTVNRLINTYNELMELNPNTSYVSAMGENIFKSIGNKMYKEHFRF